MPPVKGVGRRGAHGRLPSPQRACRSSMARWRAGAPLTRTRPRLLLLLYAVRITVIRRITGVHATGTVDPAMTREKEDHGHR